jgi:hypothetical protein
MTVGGIVSERVALADVVGIVREHTAQTDGILRALGKAAFAVGH